MRLSAPLAVEVASTGKAGSQSCSGDGKPTRSSQFGDVLTSALSGAAAAQDADPAPAANADGTNLPPSGIALPADEPASLDASVIKAAGRSDVDDDPVDPDAADIAAGLLIPLVNVVPEARLPDASGDGASAVLTTAQLQGAHQQTQLRELQLLSTFVADTRDGARGDAAVPGGSGDAASAAAPVVAELTRAGADPSTNATGGLDLSALNSAAAADVLHIAAAANAQNHSGTNLHDGGSANQPAPAATDTSSIGAARGALAALADSFAQGQPADIAANLAHRIQWMTQHGLQLARVAVTPRELGPIDIQLAQSDGVLSVAITAQHPATRELLDASAGRLRELFRGDGIDMQRFDVGGGERGPAQRDPGWHFATPGNTDDAAIPAAPPVRITLSLLDAFA